MHRACEGSSEALRKQLRAFTCVLPRRGTSSTRLAFDFRVKPIQKGVPNVAKQMCVFCCWFSPTGTPALFGAFFWGVSPKIK